MHEFITPDFYFLGPIELVDNCRSGDGTVFSVICGKLHLLLQMRETKAVDFRKQAISNHKRSNCCVCFYWIKQYLMSMLAQ